MSKVMTLEGLPTSTTRVSGTKCKETVTIDSPTLGKPVEVCKEDIARLAVAHSIKPNRGRGRPKGATVKAGAKKPRVSSCSSPRWTTKGKREFCRCSDKGNAQILPHSACGKKRKKKEK